MCGIVGYGGFSKNISLDKAIDLIKHRGPDDDGVQYFKGAALGNTRLAIIDLSEKGHQPMFSSDSNLCIVFNGEIYNFKEVKKELEKEYKFKTGSDTEVILYAYKKWGVKCLQKLNGMFSFVIFDKEKKLLFGARDRLGQKPLKYYFDNGKFVFGSEIKAILSLLDFKPKLDDIAIDDFLTLQYVPSPKTGFEKIYKLPAGHYFIHRNKKLSIHKYWSLNFNKKLKLSTKEWQELVLKEMERSIRSHLISDVPVGVLLSGGLDSSIIVALMAKHSSQKINTFSIGFDDKKFDETSYAKKVSDMYKTNHIQLNLNSNELLKNISTLAEYFDEPIGDNSILPSFLVSKLVSSKVKVALTGDGGDENFAGYDRYMFVNIGNLISKMPQPTKAALGLIVKAFYKLHPTKLTERGDRFFSSIGEKFYRKYLNYNSFFTNKTKQDLYSQTFKEKVGQNDTFESYQNLYDKDLTDLDNALKIDINTYLPDDLLYKSDTASMASGLELRAPFLDHILMEKIATMPSEMKLKLTTKKKILREIAKNNKLLPKPIINRSKMGFTIPQNKWFKGPLRKYITKQILSSGIIGSIFDQIKMEKYLKNYFETNLNYDNNIFALLMLSLWFDKYHK